MDRGTYRFGIRSGPWAPWPASQRSASSARTCISRVELGFCTRAGGRHLAVSVGAPSHSHCRAVNGERLTGSPRDAVSSSAPMPAGWPRPWSSSWGRGAGVLGRLASGAAGTRSGAALTGPPTRRMLCSKAPSRNGLGARHHQHSEVNRRLRKTQGGRIPGQKAAPPPTRRRVDDKTAMHGGGKGSG